MSVFQLQFATYTFPNNTFVIKDQSLDVDTPVANVRRFDGGVVLNGYLTPKSYRINGRIWGADTGSVHNELITMQKALHNNGDGASFFYQDDRYAFCRLSKGGMKATPEKGLYDYLYNIDIMLVDENPFVEEVVPYQASGSHNNGSEVVNMTVGGNYPTQGIFQLIAGATFQDTIEFMNTGNSYFFQYLGPLADGQTLVVDNILGCVLLHDGATMIDAISWFGGDLFMPLEDGGVNEMVVSGPTFDWTFNWQNRFYS